ncbi:MULTISPECIES: hypothetical protein [Stenotrophomonas]|uniref:hypothetical protein n=1 Tax=Stenotrophomonas TaxID=40323 RepID=UPI0018D41E7A|nr:hypothetical protein [Stenotrophomonas sp.]MBH1508052.1 hypothetical protein [Stenotrophomonas maltophilia]
MKSKAQRGHNAEVIESQTELTNENVDRSGSKIFSAGTITMTTIGTAQSLLSSMPEQNGASIETPLVCEECFLAATRIATAHLRR